MFLRAGQMLLLSRIQQLLSEHWTLNVYRIYVYDKLVESAVQRD